MKVLRDSESTTAVVVMYMGPCCTRVYRMLRMSRAFCTVSTNKLLYLSINMVDVDDEESPSGGEELL